MSRGETARLATQIGIALTAGMFSIVPVAYGAPVLDTVVSGGATVNVGTNTTINSTSKNNVINWQDFSVANGESVTFDGGAKTNNYLNIVTGSSTSAINGSLSGGNNVYIVNPNGVIFGSTAQVDVGNLYASTRPLTDIDTTAVDASGNVSPLVTDTPGALGGDIVNLGKIQADTVKVEGVNITFLNTADVTTDGTTANTNVNMIAANRIDIGDNDAVADSYTTSATSVNTHTGTGVYDQATLAAINDNLAGDYWLAQDVTVTGTYTPIGTSEAFTGTFDGAYHTVSGITVNNTSKTEGYGGLFGYASGATIQNVGVTNGNIKSFYAGGIVGYALNTTLKNVFNDGVTVQATGTGINSRLAAGIAAYSKGTTIDTAYNTAAILSANGGGIVGIIADNSTVTNTYSTQTLNSSNASKNGIVGITETGADINSIKFSNNYTTASLGGSNTAKGDGFIDIVTDVSGTTLASYSGTKLTGIGNTADTATTWRIYEGQSLPLLTAFLNAKGVYTVKYDYTQGSSVSGSNDGKDLSVTYNNNAVDFGTPTYWSNGIQVLNVDGVSKSSTTYKDVMFDYNEKSWQSDGSGVTPKTSSVYYNGQSGYNLAGSNITIKQREVNIANILNGNPTVTKEYDGTTDITSSAIESLFSGTESNSTGIISGDTTVSLDSSGVSGKFDSKDVGANKSVTLDGGLTLKNAAQKANYKLSDTSTSLTGKTISGTITQKALKVTLADNASIDKTYDGTAAVTTAPTTGIFTIEEGVTVDGSTEDVSLGLASTAAGTYVDKDGTTYTANANAGSHSVAYSGLTLAGSDAKNYKLVDADGNVLYSVAVNGVGENVNATTGGTLYAAGVINRRLINSTDFKVQDASGNTTTGTKVYDGTSDFTLADGMKVVNTGTASGDTGIVTSDADKIHFDLSSGTTSYFVQDDGTTATKNVADATKIAYQVEAGTTTGYEYLLDNYKIGTSDSDAQNLATGTTYSVLGDGAITRRALTVGLAKTTGLDKTYDTTDTLASQYTTDAAISYGTGSAKLLADDTTTASDNAAWSISGKYDSANVARDASGNVTTQGVTYRIGLTGADAANYTLNGTNAENASVQLTATGTINPKDVTAKANTITKTYDGTMGVGTSTDTTGLGFTIDGAYDSDSANIAIDYNTDNIYYADKNAGTGKTVNYTGLALSGTAAGNYNLTGANITGTGTINKRAITKNDVTATFGTIAKTYDNTTTADATQLQSLTVKNVTGDNLVFAVSKAYYNDKNRLGNADLQKDGVTYELTLTDAAQLNNYTLGDGLTGNALALTTDGYIYQRELTVAAVDTNPTKQYDGTTDVIGASGTVLTGDTLVTITGLYADGTTNATTATYSNKNVGSRTVNYALALANEPAGSSNYKFVDASGNTINSITTNGTINKRELYATFDNVTKVYDTNSTVAADKIKATLTDANGNTDSVAQQEGVTLAIGGSGVTGTYGLNTGDSFTADANVGTKTVKYTNLIAALGNNADNYTIADTTYGAGSITPASITADSFKFTFDTITKPYDGTTAIDGTDAASAVLNHYVDLGLNANPDFTYTIDSTAYKDKNAGTGKDVTYTITIDLSTLTNYEVTGVTGSTLTQSYTQNNGIINRKAVYASIKNNALTKTYDATTAVKDASGTVLTGDDIITLDGLTGNDGATNISTAAYTDKNVGAGNKVINYTVALDAASAGNYVIYKDADKGAANKTELTSAWASAAVNTITPYSLKLAFSQAVKDYDGTTDVYTANGSAAANLESGLAGDTVSLATGYTAAYDDPNVKGKKGDGSHTVTYDNLVLTGADAGNYILADANGTTLGAGTTAGTYTTTGDGIINKFKLTEAPTFKLATVTKEYDGTDAVAYTGTGKDGKYYYRDKSADALQNYVLSDATVTVNGKTMPVYFTISNAKYTAGKDVGTNKDVSFVVTLSGDNYDFSGLNGINADGSFSGAATATTGDITKRGIYISLDDSIIAEKTYDGDALVDNDVTGKIIVRESDILDDDKASVSLDRTAINATYADKDAGTGKTVNYTLTLTGAGSENYEIHDLTKLGATGDDAITSIESNDGIINKAKLTVSFDGGINKTYDGTSAIDPTKIQSHDVHFKGYVEGEDLGDLSRTALDTIKGDYGTGTSAADFTTDANVSWNEDTLTSKAMHYDLADLNEWLKTDSVGKNYELVATDVYYSAAANKGRIDPIYVDNIEKTWTQAAKVYDATTDLPIGTKDSDYLTIKANASDGTELNVVYTTDSAGYDNKNVGTDHKLVYDIDRVEQKLSADGGATYNYYLADSTTAGLLGEQTSAANNTISVRTITATLGTTTGIDKVYDATTDVLAPYTDGSNLTLTDDDLAVLAKDDITPTITSAYDGKDAGAHKVIYTLSGIDSANYSLTDGGIYTASGEIAKATLNVDFGAIDRTYEKGNTAIKLTGDKITLSGVAGETVDLTDAALALIKGNYGRGGSEANFTADGNVSWNGDTVADKDVLYTGLADALASQIAGGDSIASNYTIADTAYFTAAQAKGKIKPIAITQGATANWTAATKTYDATTAVLDPEKYLGITYTDANGDVIDIGYELAAAAYDSKNVGDNRTLNYTLKSVDKKLTADGTNYNYVLDDGYADTLVGDTWTSAANNTIKKLTINAALKNTTGIDKVYDGTTEVLAAYQGESNLVIDKAAQDVLARDGISAVITESYDEANAGDRKVTYTLGLDTISDNYELASDTYQATGTIARRGLTITATPEKVRVGDAMPDFTGTVTGYVASDASLIEEFQNKLLNFKVDDDVTTAKPGKYAVYGWYTNAAGETLTAGDFGQNYTFSQDASNATAFYVELVDPGREYHENVNPKTQFIPDHTAYNQAAMDYSGAYRGNGAAALEYQDSRGTVLGEIAITGVATGTNNITGTATVTRSVDTDAAVMARGADASYGIAGGNVVNIEGAAVATSASVEVAGDGEIVNLEVRPLKASEIAIESTDSTDGATA